MYGQPCFDPIHVQLIGAAAAIQDPMKEVKAFREEASYQNWRRMKIKLLTIVRFGGTLRNNNKSQAGMADAPKLQRRSSMAKLREASTRLRNDAKQTVAEAKDSVKNKVSRWSKKVQGKWNAFVL